MRAPHRPWAPAVAMVFGVQLALMALAGSQNLYALNPDGVAYLRLASYYAQGEASLMISSYWGPLLSWLMAPLLWLGVPPLVAARVAVGLSSWVFLAGCVVLFRCLRLSAPATVLATCLCALATLSWSLKLNPDLLAAGLGAAATGLALTTRWLSERAVQAAAGVLFGVAYLAKPMVIAVAVATVVAVSLGRVLLGQVSAAGGARASAVTLAGAGALALPWVVVISLHHGAPTLSTSARINHAIVGPHEAGRQHPLLLRFHRPDPGRVTQWEEPSKMGYRYWSPLESRTSLRHQLHQIRTNAARIGYLLLTLDHLALGLLALIVAPFSHRPLREGLRRDPWRWAGLPVGILCGLYLPFYAEEPRYYYACFPFLLAAGFGLAGSFGASRRGLRLGAHLLLGASLLQPSGLLSIARGGHAQGSALRADFEAAERLRSSDLLGPVAGVQGIDGLYLAFFAGVPYLGSERRFDPARLLRSGARIVVARRDTPPARRLERNTRFESLDAAISAQEDGTGLPGFVLFQILPTPRSPAPPR